MQWRQLMSDIREKARQFVIALANVDTTYSASTTKIGSQPTELWLMYALDDGKSHSQKQICDEWGFPRTTLNTIIKKCEEAGYLTLSLIPGKRREMQICLTESGKAYAKQLLGFFYQAENRAMEETLKHYPAEFIDAIIYYNKSLRAEFDRELGIDG